MSSPNLRALIFLPAIAFVALGTLSEAQPPQQVGSWVSSGLSVPGSSGAAAVALADGRTLIAGGTTDDGPTDAVVIYDPVAEAIVSAGHLIAPRTGHTATLLEDGRVLVVGGVTNGSISTDVELFDPALGTSVLVALLGQPRTAHAAARIAGNRVLIIGGTTIGGGVLKSVEVFDATTGGVVPDALAQLNERRTGASATTLIDGRVLVVGGSNGAEDLGSAELYNPYAQTFSLLTSTQLTVPRSGHTALLLPHNAGVLVSGGSTAGVPVAAADVFLPAEFPDPFSWGVGSFVPTGGMTTARTGAISGPVGDQGFAFVAGGGAGSTERYRYATIKTDKNDYAPGELAIITGSGWRPGEEVELLFQEDPAVHLDYRFTVVADAAGNLVWDRWAPEEHDLNVRFYLTATGSTSRAQTTFTDSRTLSTIELLDPSTNTFVMTPSTITVGGGTSVTVRVTGSTNPSGGGANPAAWQSTAWTIRGPAPANSPVDDDCDSSINVSTTTTNATHLFSIPAPAGAGTYSVTAQGFSGDGCVGTPASNTVTYPGGLIVTVKADPTVTTTIHTANESVVAAAIPLGSTVHDFVTVSGSGATPSGNVTFLFYNNDTCSGIAAATSGAFSLTNGSADATSFQQGPLAAGGYSFKAQYGGDASYNAKDGTCEPLTVNKAQLTVVSAVHDSVHTNKTNGSVPLGAIVHDTASLTGVVGSFAAPALTFTFYANSTCDGPGSAVLSDGPDEGLATSSRSAASNALAAGSYAYKASVAGDDNYDGDDSDCEPFTVNAQTTTTTASIQTTTPQYSDKVTLRATVSPHTVGPFEVTGTMYFYIGTSAVTCTPAVPAGSVGSDLMAAADDGVAEIEPQLTDAAGNRTVTACFYSSSANFTSSGGTETLTIDRENAMFTNVVFTGSIPVSQTSFQVAFDVKELLIGGAEPDTNAGALPGDISKVGSITAKLVGISTNSQYTASCNGGSGGSASYASARSVICTFSGNPFVVDAYTLSLEIPAANVYFEGAFEDAMSVWDPNAGFATGGGTFSLNGDRVSFGFSYTSHSKNLRSGFVVVRHLAGGGVCRVKSNNQMNVPAVNGNTVTLSGKGNYTCTDALGNTTASQGNITISAYAEDNDTSGAGADKFWVSNAAAPTPNYLKMPLNAGTNAVLLAGGNVQVPQPSNRR